MNCFAWVSMFRVLVPLCLFLLLAPTAHTQITNATNDTSTPIEGAGHDFM